MKSLKSSQKKKKYVEFFKRKELIPKSFHMDSNGHSAQTNEATLEDSYRIAVCTAECQKSHTIG
jgi:hypothetical protein